jgi:hypothetical protein
MTIEMAIIPISAIHEPNAHHLFNTLKAIDNVDLNILIDTNYFASLKTRVAKYRRQKKDIIVVDNNYLNNSKITVRFAGSGNHATFMPIQELIELLSTLEEEAETEAEAENKNDEFTNTNSKVESEERICTVM